MLKNSLTQLLQIKYPIIQAPMAGGITTTELVTSVSNYGGLGSVGAGYMSPDALRQQIKEIKVQTEHNFGVNIFVPSPFETTTEQIEKADQYLQRIRHQLKMDEEHTTKLPTYSETLDTYHKQVEVVLEERVPVVSFTFGLPEEQIVTKLKDKGIIVMATATTVAEAIEVERLGIDVVIAQGSEAGGHRGNFILPTEESLIGVMSLVPQIVDQVNLPVIAAGGIMDGRGIIASLVLGAQAAQMGTAFLMTKESGTHPKYKQAISQAEESDTRLTSAFSGKHARGLRNKFMSEMEGVEHSLPSYPVQNTLTQSIRRVAQTEQNEQYMSLWSGQTPRLARHVSVNILMENLISETKSIIEGFGNT